MKANEYIKKNGIANAKKILAMGSNALVNTGDNECFHTDDLKRLIESHELVESYGGLDGARKEAHKNCFMFNYSLLKAIADVESCL